MAVIACAALITQSRALYCQRLCSDARVTRVRACDYQTALSLIAYPVVANVMASEAAVQSLTLSFFLYLSLYCPFRDVCDSEQWSELSEPGVPGAHHG